MTVFNPIAASFLAQYERAGREGDIFAARNRQLALSRNGLWLRQGDADHQSVVHANGVSNKGVRLKDVIVFLYCGLDNACGHIDAESAKLQDHAWRLTNAWVSGPDGHPVFHATYDPADGSHTVGHRGKFCFAGDGVLLGSAALYRDRRERRLLGRPSSPLLVFAFGIAHTVCGHGVHGCEFFHAFGAD